MQCLFGIIILDGEWCSGGVGGGDFWNGNKWQIEMVGEGFCGVEQCIVIDVNYYVVVVIGFSCQLLYIVFVVMIVK